MSKDKMQTARELIQAKRYSEARAILNTVDDNPLAKEWLARLDAIDPFGDIENTPQKGKPGSKKKRRRSPLWLVGMAFVCLVVAYLASGGTQGLQERQASATAQQVAQQATADADASIVALTPPTATSTITDTPRPSETPIPSSTPLPTATPSLEQQARQVAEDVLVGEVISVEDNSFVPSLVIVFEMPQDFSGYNVDYTGDQMLEMTCRLREIAPTYRLLFTAQIDTIDQFGNEGTAQGLNVLLLPEIIQQINCENAIMLDVRNLAETYDLHRLLR